MKNINCYYENAVMVDYNWLATPFVLNYGYDPLKYGYTDTDDNGNIVGFDDYWMEWDYDNQCYQNNFGMEKSKYEKYIRWCKRPSNWKASFVCGDMAYAKYGSPNRKYNTIQLLFQQNGVLKIGAIWKSSDKMNPKTDDYSLIGRVRFGTSFDKLLDKTSFPKLITYDCMLFKYTMNIYEESLRIRFDKSFFNDDLQYTGRTRFDSGNKFIFSVIPTAMKLDNESVSNCISTMQRLHRLSMYEV